MSYKKYTAKELLAKLQKFDGEASVIFVYETYAEREKVHVFELDNKVYVDILEPTKAKKPSNTDAYIKLGCGLLAVTSAIYLLFKGNQKNDS